jgi:glyoxalase family protein
LFHRYHHITSTVTGARSDISFHVDFLGLRLIKKTVLLDGVRPFYHLYYGTGLGEPGSLLTSFVFGPETREGRRGSGQVSSIALSVPASSLSFWADRLAGRGNLYSTSERFGEPRLSFDHPDGLHYQLVGVERDDRFPWIGSDIPSGAAVRGIHSVTVCTRETDELHEFLTGPLEMSDAGVDCSCQRFLFSKGEPGQMLEIDHQPDTAQGSWGYRRNTVDHVAFDIGDSSAQLSFKASLESIGFIDVTEPRDRNYFSSVYFRSPAGAMFEAAWTHEGGFLKDESELGLGQTLQLPSWLEENASGYLDSLEAIPT